MHVKTAAFYSGWRHVNIVCEYSESGLLPHSVALARIEATRTQLDVHADVFGAIDNSTGDDFLWVLAGVERAKRQVCSRRI